MGFIDRLLGSKGTPLTSDERLAHYQAWEDAAVERWRSNPEFWAAAEEAATTGITAEEHLRTIAFMFSQYTVDPFSSVTAAEAAERRRRAYLDSHADEAFRYYHGTLAKGLEIANPLPPFPG